jgi:rod shape-determining protein MreC
VEIGMNVVADGGLVGLVTDVGPTYAKVRSIVDDTSSISAMDITTNEYCIVNGSLKTMNELQQIEFSDLRISGDSKAQAGDKLVTSNISSRYLKGIPIGYITDIKNDTGNLTRSGKLVPIVDFSHLEHVQVILETKNYTSEDN